MARIASGRGGTQLLETQVVHIRCDAGKPRGQILEGVPGISHLRSLPASRRDAVTTPG